MAATMNFFRYEIKILAKVIEFRNRENTYNYTAHANFYRDFPTIFFSSYILQFLKYSFWSWNMVVMF